MSWLDISDDRSVDCRGREPWDVEAQETFSEGESGKVREKSFMAFVQMKTLVAEEHRMAKWLAQLWSLFRLVAFMCD